MTKFRENGICEWSSREDFEKSLQSRGVDTTIMEETDEYIVYRNKGNVQLVISKTFKHYVEQFVKTGALTVHIDTDLLLKVLEGSVK